MVSETKEQSTQVSLGELRILIRVTYGSTGKWLLTKAWPVFKRHNHHRKKLSPEEDLLLPTPLCSTDLHSSDLLDIQTRALVMSCSEDNIP